MEFSKQEYWSGLSFPSPGDLPNPGIEPRSLALQADSLPDEPPGRPPVALLWQPLKKKNTSPQREELWGFKHRVNPGPRVRETLQQVALSSVSPVLHP